MTTGNRSYQEFPPNADTGGQGETGCGCECPDCQAGQHDKCFWDGGDNLPRYQELPSDADVLTPLELTEMLCEEAWQGRWDPLCETNVRPLAASLSLVLDLAGYAVVRKP